VTLARSLVIVCALLAAGGCRKTEREPAVPTTTTEPELAAADDGETGSPPEPKLDTPEPLPPDEPPPVPAPFAGRESVRVDELLAALRDEVATVAASPAVRADYEVFLTAFELSHDDELYLDYVRIKIAFEATRAGGLWGLRWTITNEQPNSDLVWAQWQTLALGPAPQTIDELAALPIATADAECDELSALFSFVAQRIGLSRTSEVGLLWPVPNHTVAVWTIAAKSEHPTRVVVPTSQVFLDGAQSLGTREFNPRKQKTIYDYRRQDAANELELPGALASAFVQAVRSHAALGQADLQALRNSREANQY
jgi:hypothetical protein